MTKGVIVVLNLAVLSKDISPFRVAKNDPLHTHIQDHLRTDTCTTDNKRYPSKQENVQYLYTVTLLIWYNCLAYDFRKWTTVLGFGYHVIG